MNFTENTDIKNCGNTVPKKDFVIAIPYLGKLSLQIRTRINPVLEYPVCFPN